MRSRTQPTVIGLFHHKSENVIPAFRMLHVNYGSLVFEVHAGIHHGNVIGEIGGFDLGYSKVRVAEDLSEAIIVRFEYFLPRVPPKAYNIYKLSLL
jgi:hypothetical protein